MGHFILLGILYLSLFFIFKSYLENKVISLAQREAQIIFNNLYKGMQKGFTREELDSLVKLYQREDLSVKLFYTGAPSQAYQFSSQESIAKEKYQIKYKSPIKASQECITCHTFAKEGALLGILEIDLSYERDIKFIHKALLVFLLVFLFLPLVGVYVIGKIQSKRLAKPISEIGQRISQARKFSELVGEKEPLKIPATGIDEIDELAHKVEEFVEAVKNLAVDREVFEFELSLLEKFIITSELVKDWKYYVNKLIEEINRIVKIPLVFLLFYVEEEIFDVEIFWLKEPPSQWKIEAERKIKSLVEGYLPHNVLNFVHNAVYPDISFEETILPEFHVKTKTLILESPKIGGIVGVGLTFKELTSTQEMAVQTVLSSLLNVIGSIKAISKYTRELEFYATRDPLTQLYNQRVFWELLHYEIERAKRYNYKFALLIIDLDNFKFINDKYGHAFGDKFLQEVARVLENQKRKGDILARYGGDEFTLIIPYCDVTQAYLVAERIREAIANLKVTAPDKMTATSTCSIGVSVFPDHGEEAKDLFMISDTLMYKAKKEGKNKIIIPTSKDIITYHKEVTEWALIIKNAIEERKIVPYFQPIYELSSCKLLGCEVLMRLNFEDKHLPASKFIPLAESLGLVTTMDYLNLEKAFAKVKETSFEAMLFLNLSPKALVIRDFLEKILALVKTFNILPEQIVFELTERETVKNLQLLEKFIKALQYYGFHFCIDDFGSGFSSFQYIKHFIIDFVKIEGEFIMGLSNEVLIDQAILESMVALCKRLGIKMIAEYVENEEVIKKLRDLGIEFGQGFYFGRPSPELDFPEIFSLK